MTPETPMPLKPCRKKFEKWLLDDQGLTATWNQNRNCYDQFPAHLAWKAWNYRADLVQPQAAVPKDVQEALSVWMTSCETADDNGITCHFTHEEARTIQNALSSPVAGTPQVDLDGLKRDMVQEIMKAYKDGLEAGIKAALFQKENK